jgi:hypothetical protein
MGGWTDSNLWVQSERAAAAGVEGGPDSRGACEEGEEDGQDGDYIDARERERGEDPCVPCCSPPDMCAPSLLGFLRLCLGGGKT